jgi:glycerophosphoryl diester phosphodiesterase
MSDNPWRRDERPLSIAHRGHSIAYPENTRLAYQKAIDMGIEMIECDVNLTRDGVLVMIHDWTLDRTTNGRGRVRDATWDEIQRLDAGGKFNPEFAGLPVPTTEDTLLQFRDAGILGCFEVKGGDAEEANRIAAALIELFLKHDALSYALMSSYYHGAMALAKARAPELMLAPERLPDDAPPDPPEAVRQAQALGSSIIQHEYSVMSEALVRVLHANDIAVWAWPTTTEASLVQSINLGADALMGDDVGTMLAVLDRLRPKRA